MKSYIQPITSIIFLLLLVGTATGKSQTNIQIITEEAKIYAEPDINASVSINAQEGDVFTAKDIGNDWIQINLFSGAERFVKKSDIKIIDEVPPYPSSPSIRSSLCSKVEEAKNKAQQKALSKDTENYFQQELYESLFADKYILEAFREFNIPATHFSKLMECVEDDLF